MNATRLIVCLVASVPAGWVAGALYERIPTRRRLWKPVPRLHLGGVNLSMQVIITGLFALAGLVLEDESPWVLAAYLVFFTAAVVLSFIDLDTLRLPDAIVAGALAISIPLITVGSIAMREPAQIQYAIIGGLSYFGFLLAMHLVFPRGLGFGDVKLAMLLGLFLGWMATSGITAFVLVLYAAMAGFLVGSFVGIALFAFRRKSVSYPFGPFLIGGAVVVIAFSAQLLPAGV